LALHFKKKKKKKKNSTNPDSTSTHWARLDVARPDRAELSKRCTYLASRLASVGSGATAKQLVDVSSAYLGASNARVLLKHDKTACKLTPSADAKRIVREALTDANGKLGPLHHAVSALSAGMDAGVTAAELASAAGRVAALRAAATGKYRGDPADSKGRTASALHAGRAVEALCMLASLGAPVDGGAVRAGLGKLLETSAKTDGESLWFEDASSDLAATSAVAVAIECAAGKLKQSPAASDEQLVQLAEYFVGQRHAGNVHTAFHATRGLAAFATASALPTPLVLSIVPGSGTSLTRKDETMHILVVDVFGARSSAVDTLEIVRAVRDAEPAAATGKGKGSSKGKSAAEAPKELLKGARASRVAGKDGEFEFAFLKETKAAAGMHTVTLRGAAAAAAAAAKGKGKGKGKGQGSTRSIGVDEADYAVKVSTAVKLKEIIVAVSDLGKVDARDTVKHTPRFPDRVKGKVRATPFQHLHFGFAVTGSLAPTQAFVRFSPRGNSGARSVTVNASPVLRGKKGTYMLSLALSEAAGDFAHAAGDYDVSLIVGHHAFEAPIKYDVATVSLEFQVPDIADEEEDEEDKAFGPRKEIHHLFRDPAPRPATTVSLVFAAIQIALPFVVLLPLLKRSGANLDNFPTGGTALLYAVGFQASIAALLVLFAVFWIGLNAFSTFYLVVLIAPVAVFTGHGALSHVHGKRNGSQ
jgi:hypothetical protein